MADLNFSQVLAGIAPGESRELLIMNPQGHIEHACGAIDDGQTLYLTSPGPSDCLSTGRLAQLKRFALRVETHDFAALVVAWKHRGEWSFPVRSGCADMERSWPGNRRWGSGVLSGSAGESLAFHIHLVPREPSPRILARVE